MKGSATVRVLTREQAESERRALIDSLGIPLSVARRLNDDPEVHRTVRRIESLDWLLQEPN